MERKLVTVLFADVTGSTSIGERLDPEGLQDVLATYFAAMREEVEAEGGTVEKFIGDAIMAVFGVPVAHEDDPTRALRASVHMLRRLNDVNEELRRTHGVSLRIRLGVNTGEVLASIEPRPDEPMITGDAVNVAARLQTAAEPGQVMVAERTARAARGFRFGEALGLELKGKSHPVQALPLVGEMIEPGPPARGIPGLSAPMLGRDRELELLLSLYERVAEERRPHLVTIYGDPGVGKSRLTREFVTRVTRDDPSVRVVQGRCLPYGDGITYWPLAEILKGHAGIRDTDTTQEVLAKVADSCDVVLATDTVIPPELACAALAYTVGVEDPAHPMRTSDPRQVRRQMHAAWRSFFTALAAEHPLLVVIEDIHWADPALLDLLEEVADRTEGPAMFLCPARPDLGTRRPGWGGGRRNASSIALDPLAADEADRLVSLLLAVEDLPAQTHRQILDRAEGNPFFLEEIIRHLIDERLIVHEHGRWRAAEGLAEVRIPDTVQAVLASRMDLLEPSAKRALQLAAVVGRVFWPTPVGLLLNGDRENLGELLVALEERDLVRSRIGSTIAGEPEFIFKHVLTRDVAYESLPHRDRSQAHAVVAGWIETTTGTRRIEFTELLAYHYEEACRGERDDPHGNPERVGRLRAQAIDTLLGAAEAARRRFAVQKAFGLVERALDLAEEPLERARALEQMGRTALADYRGDLGWESFREAVDLRLLHAPEDAPAIARACARAVEFPTRWPGSMTRIPQEEEVDRYLQIGFAHAGEGDGTTRVRLLTARAFGPFAFVEQRGISPEEAADARSVGEEAADMAERLGRPDLASAALDAAASGFTVLGYYGTAADITERRAALAERFDDPWEEGDVLAVASWAWGAIGEFPRAASYARRGRERAASASAEGIAIHCSVWEVTAQFYLGNWDAILDEILPEVDTLLGERRSDPPYFTQNLYGIVALVSDIRGGSETGRRARTIAERMATPSQEVGIPTAVAGGAWLSWLHAHAGDREEAERWYRNSADTTATRAHWPVLLSARALGLAEAARWDEVPAFLAESRRYAIDAGLRALPGYLDRLEGQAALAAGETEEAIHLLVAARETFGELSARWERACTDVALAEVLVRAGRSAEARETLVPALTALEELRSLREIELARELLTAL